MSFIIITDWEIQEFFFLFVSALALFLASPYASFFILFILFPEQSVFLSFLSPQPFSNSKIRELFISFTLERDLTSASHVDLCLSKTHEERRNSRILCSVCRDAIYCVSVICGFFITFLVGDVMYHVSTTLHCPFVIISLVYFSRE